MGGRILAGWCAVSAVTFVGLLPAPASATLFVYDQMSASVPNLTISASITVDGGLGDLPKLNQDSNPTGFGNLLGFSLLAPNGVTYTLSDFVPRSIGFEYPLWSISPSTGGAPPGGISFNDGSRDFAITFDLSGTIHFNTEVPTDVPIACHASGTCFTTGRWDPVPEPSGGALLVVGLLGIAFTRLRHRRSAD